MKQLENNYSLSFFSETGKRIAVVLFFFLIHFSSYSQDCQSSLSIPRNILEKNKIREVKIYSVDTLSREKTIMYQFFLDNTGFVYRMLSFDDPERMGEVFRNDCSCSKDSLLHVYKSASILPDGTLKNEGTDSVFLNQKKKLIRRRQDMHHNGVRKITIFTLDPEATGHITTEKIHLEKNDTIFYSLHLKNDLFDDYTVREIVNGITVEKRTVFEYRSGILYSYSEYRNRKLIKSITYKDFKTFAERISIEMEDEELPRLEPVYTDTISTKITSWEEFKISGISTTMSTRLLMSIIHYEDYHKKHISYIEKYYTNGLIHSIREFHKNTIEIYEYSVF